jgi:ParB family transcriptional regulator, chromosome partitioning protein
MGDSSLVAEGHAWVQCHTPFGHSDRAEFVKARTVSRPPTAGEQAAMDALDAEREAIEAEYEGYGEDEDGETYAALEKKSGAVQGKIAALRESLEEPDADDVAIAGAVVTVDHAGELRIERGLILKADVKKLPRGQGTETGVEASGKPRRRSPFTRRNSRAC